MYEYKVIEAPAYSRRGWFSKSAGYAEQLSDTINELALDKWEYQHAECGLVKSTDMLVFRRKIVKQSEEMPEPKRFSDRLLEAETRSQHARHEDGQTYGGPVRPRRARIILNDAGTITERPQTIAPHTIDATATPYEGKSTATERVTPYKPSMAAAEC